MIYKSIEQLEYLTDSSKDLTWQERATWYVALAKMYASMQYITSYSHRSYDHSILGYLERASSIVYASKKEDCTQKWLDIELMRVLFWASRIEIVYKVQAIDVCSNILEQSEFTLSDQQISRVYCCLGYSWSMWIFQAFETENIVSTPEHNLWFLMAILNSKWYPEDEFTQQMNLASLAMYFKRFNKYQESRACHYQQLINACNHTKKGTIDNPLFNFYSLINEIQQDAIQLRLNEEYVAWNKFLNPYFDLDYIPYTKNTIGSLSQKMLDSASQQYLSSPLSQLYFDQSFDIVLQRSLILLSEENAKRGKWDVAYNLRAKADSIKFTDGRIRHAYELGSTSSSNWDYSVIQRLEDDTSQLRTEVDIKKKELLRTNAALGVVKEQMDNYIDSNKVLFNQIVRTAFMLDSMKMDYGELRQNYLYTQDSLGTIKQLSKDLSAAWVKEKNASSRYKLAWVITSVLTAITIILFFIAYRQRRIARFHSKLSDFKASIWQEFGHIPGPAINNSYQKLVSIGIERQELVDLIVLESLVAILFSNLKKGSKQIAISIEDEIESCKRYIQYKESIHSKRISFSVNEYDKGLLIPPAILLSLIKNSIQSGLSTMNQNLFINLKIELQPDWYIVTVIDNGKGFPKHIRSTKDIESGTGLKNINEILNFYNNTSKRQWLEIKPPGSAANMAEVSLTIKRRNEIKNIHS